MSIPPLPAKRIKYEAKKGDLVTLLSIAIKDETTLRHVTADAYAKVHFIPYIDPHFFRLTHSINAFFSLY